MRKNILTTVIALFMTISFISNAQDKYCNKKSDKTKLQQVTAFLGQVSSWTNNDDYVYNGFYLQTIKDKFLVKFPLNRGSKLITTITVGSTITVNGVERLSPQGEKEIKLVGIIFDGKNIYDSLPVVIDSPSAEEFINSSGKISELQKDKKNNVKVYILDNKTILRVPPHIAEQLKNLAVVGANISYSGDKQNLLNGEVALDSYTIIHCKTITINGKEYLTN